MSAIQTFMRMANLYNPQNMDPGGMPAELPVPRPTASLNPMEPPPLINRGAPSVSVPGAYQQPGMPEEEMAQPGGSSTLDAFRQSVMNPPQRTQMTYPKSTLNGLDAALKIAAEPSPLAKNRVWVNGQAHQKQQLYTDPETGEKKFITNVHEPAFMDQVMRAMPASISGAIDTLNQPHADAVTDWELKNKGLGAAAKAEADSALAAQRNANAGAVPTKLAQIDRGLDIKSMDAGTRAKLASLRNLTDSQKLEMLHQNKITLQDLNSAAQLERLERSGEIKSDQIAQQGDIRTGQIAQQGGITSGHIEQRGQQAIEQIGARGAEARGTKIAPGNTNASVTNSSHTQQRQAAVNRASEVINAHPEWADKISIDPVSKMPVIAQPNDPYFGDQDFTEYDKIYEALYGKKRGAETAAPVATPTTTRTPAPAKKAASPVSGKVRVTSPDGKSGTWDLSKGPIPNGFKKIQ